MKSKSTQLVIDDRKFKVPAPVYEPLETLWDTFDRMPNWLPPSVNRVAFFTAIATEANAVAMQVASDSRREVSEKGVNVPSLIRACFNTAAIGLMPGSALGHSYFVPFKTVVSLIIGYRGFTDLAYGTGFLRGFTCDVVLAGEECERWNSSSGPELKHQIDMSRERDNYSEVQSVYCQYQTTAGWTDVVSVSKKELDKIKAKQTRGNNSIWRDNPIAMSLKTPLRRSTKRWKLSGQMANAVMLDEASERFESQPLIEGYDDFPVVEKKPIDLNGLGSNEPPHEELKEY